MASVSKTDAIGRWRASEGDGSHRRMDTLPDGTSFNGPGELRAQSCGGRGICQDVDAQPLTYAVGRGLSPTTSRWSTDHEPGGP
jgi:hypothetical protein